MPKDWWQHRENKIEEDEEFTARVLVRDQPTTNPSPFQPVVATPDSVTTSPDSVTISSDSTTRSVDSGSGGAVKHKEYE